MIDSHSTQNSTINGHGIISGVGTKSIAFYLPRLSGGGAERTMIDLAKGFDERGFTVDFILSVKEGPYANEIPESINVVEFGVRRFYRVIPRLVRYLRDNKPPVLISSLRRSNIIALFAGRLARVNTKICVREDNVISLSVKNPRKGWLQGVKTRMEPHLIKFFYPRAYSVVSVSGGVKYDIQKHTGISGRNLSTIYNPVNIEYIARKSGKECEHEWLKEKSVPVVLAVGRLTKQKDFPTLLRAFSIALEKRPLRLIILGEGDLRSDLEHRIRELGLDKSVSMPGFVSNPYAYMARSDIFVLSSAWEGLGNVLIEAMAVGLPVVATNCESGPSEILQNGEFGPLVPVGDAGAMADAILDAIDEPVPVDKLKKRAGDFSLSNIISEYINLLNDKTRKHVAVYLPRLSGGGAERVVINLLKEFIERGIRVDLILSVKEGPYVKDIPEGVHIIELGVRRIFRVIPKLAAYLRLNNPELLFSTLRRPNMVAIASKILSGSKARVVIREANMISTEVNERSDGLVADLKRIMEPFMLKQLYPRADAIVALTEDMKLDINSILRGRGKQISVIHNPTDIHTIRSRACETVGHPWLSDGAGPVLIAVGKLAKQKDYPTLIKAFARVRAMRQVRLIILGQGPEQETIQHMIQRMHLENDVDIAGFAENPYAYIARANLLILSSAWEGLPNVLIEALAVGTPVVSTNCKSGPSEILHNGVYGTLVPVGDDLKMADAILHTLDQPPDKIFIKQRADKYSAEHIIPQYINLFFERGRNGQ